MMSIVDGLGPDEQLTMITQPGKAITGQLGITVAASSVTSCQPNRGVVRVRVCDHEHAATRRP